MKILNLILSVFFWGLGLLMIIKNRYDIASIQILFAISFELRYYYEDLKDIIKEKNG